MVAKKMKKKVKSIKKSTRTSGKPRGCGVCGAVGVNARTHGSGRKHGSRP